VAPTNDLHPTSQPPATRHTDRQTDILIQNNDLSFIHSFIVHDDDDDGGGGLLLLADTE